MAKKAAAKGKATAKAKTKSKGRHTDPRFALTLGGALILLGPAYSKIMNGDLTPLDAAQRFIFALIFVGTVVMIVSFLIIPRPRRYPSPLALGTGRREDDYQESMPDSELAASDE